MDFSDFREIFGIILVVFSISQLLSALGSSCTTAIILFVLSHPHIMDPPSGTAVGSASLSSSSSITIKEGAMAWTGVIASRIPPADRWKRRFFVLGRRALLVFRHHKVC
jgi:hypothetical protein